ncbi:hypothetical protein [Faecalibacter sp. LW9]|uniref:hypothetical protein n=1 Tax=Faecalibacter sp. LW9 TaxID=3103144 RepID=UPI002AFEF16C|nr:hypothetical protein [Faecalibacter sp. LW9]
MKYIFFLLFIFSSSAFGCSCARSSLKDSFTRSDAIFIGKVIAVDSTKYDFSSNPVYAYTFEIEKDFKREFTQEKSKKYYTTIYTPLASLFGGCGMTFQLNESYLVYGYRTSLGVDTDICTRTDVLKDVSKNEINELEKLKKEFLASNEMILPSNEDDDLEVLSKEFDLYQLTAERKEKFYGICLSVLGILLIVSLIFNFRRK